MKSLLPLLALSGTIIATPAFGSYVVAGSLQTEQSDPADWDPPNSSIVMAESGGIYTATVSNLLSGTLYEFKVLDDGGTPPANWGDPEPVPVNTGVWGDADGSSLITVNTNVVNINGNAQVWATTDAAPFQVVGNFMDEAGGAGDWAPADATFAMTAQGSGYYTFNATISTVGSYEFKVTDGTGWDRQVGPDGFSNNAGTFAFSTSAPSEQIVMFLDVENQTMGVTVIPEPSISLLGALAGLFLIRRRR